MSVAVDRCCFPNFLGIGAMKAGTTWLWRQLNSHPEVWMPPIKELHYFDRNTSYPSPSFLATESVLKRLLRTNDHDIQNIQMFRSALKKDIITMNGRNLRWHLRFFLGNYSDNWYASLFRHGGAKCRGEITPAYSMLNQEDVAHIKNLIADVKIVFLIRNPIDRTWSHIRDDRQLRKIPIDKVSKDFPRMKAFIDNPRQELRSDYIRTLKIWRSVFPQEQFFLGFFEDIQDEPEILMERICFFLGIEKQVQKEAIRKKANESRQIEMPIEIKKYLAKKYIDQIEDLSRIVGGHAMSWLQQARSYL